MMAESPKRGKMENLRKILIPIILFILATGCEDVRLHGFRSLQGGWNVCDTLEYAYCAPDGRDGSFAIDVQLRCEASYPYSELWLGVQCVADSAGLLSADTLRCEIFDSLGRHSGTTGGILYQTAHPLGVRQFPAGDTVRVRLYHLMDCGTVKGVTDAGIKITSLSQHQF